MGNGDWLGIGSIAVAMRRTHPTRHRATNVDAGRSQAVAPQHSTAQSIARVRAGRAGPACAGPRRA